MTEALHITRILVPVDGSEYSRHATEHALRIARAYSAEIVFVHAVDHQIVAELTTHEAGDGPQIRDRLWDNGRIYLRDSARVAEEHHVAHREEIDEGDPCAVICDIAARDAADLIVMGKIGRRGARRIMLGSVTRRVAEATDRPVLIVTGPPSAGS
ncbi:MAG TPA: universal stress protein [Candidatus Binatia bacterium]|nr:universal stress protein [Candidatus Binatia bacterium]